MTRGMFKDFDLGALRRNKRIAFYFRYPLYHSEFHELHDPKTGHLLGRFAAKPLYGRLTRDGRVDRSAGFNGQVAVIFVPARARSAGAAQLLLARMAKAKVMLPDGHRNWHAIHAAAERSVRRHLQEKQNEDR
ncbi:MAG: hypothetical protein ACM3S0_15815 [Acidobacteriota bacterium]